MGRGGQATEKHRAGQVAEGGESFPENWDVPCEGTGESDHTTQHIIILSSLSP